MGNGHHKIAAAVFVAGLIIGCAMILSAELTKPARYEFHTSPQSNTYVIFDRDTGRAATVPMDAKNPTTPLEQKD